MRLSVASMWFSITTQLSLTNSFRRDRCFASYILLLRTVPRVKDLIEDSEQEDELTDLLDKVIHVH